VGGGGAQAAEPIEIGALHHALFIDVSAEEARAIRFKRMEDRFGGKLGGLLPAFDHDAAALGIERDDRAAAVERFEEGGVDAAPGERAGADDDAVGALRYE